MYRRMLMMALLAVLVALAIALGTLLALARWEQYYSFYYEGIVANQEIYFTNDAQTGRVEMPGTLAGRQCGSVAR